MRISDWSSDVCSSDLTGRGVVPTARADQLDPLVRDLITRLHRLGEPVAFDPTTSERTFRLALYENPAVMLIPALVRRLQSTGPNIRIAVVAPEIGRASCRERVCQDG